MRPHCRVLFGAVVASAVPGLGARHLGEKCRSKGGPNYTPESVCNIPSNCDAKALDSFSRGSVAELVAVRVLAYKPRAACIWLGEHTRSVRRRLVPAVRGSTRPPLLLVLVVCRHGEGMGILVRKGRSSEATPMRVKCGGRRRDRSLEACRLVSRLCWRVSESATALSQACKASKTVQRSRMTEVMGVAA